MASAERQPITGVSGRSPQQGPGARGQIPPEAESFTTFGRPTEAITFMSFAIFCKLATPNFGYTMSRQDLTKFYIWQIFILSLHLKDTNGLYTANIEKLILAIYNNN